MADFFFPWRFFKWGGDPNYLRYLGAHPPSTSTPHPQHQDLVRAFEGRKLPVPRDDMMPSDLTEVGATSSHTKKNQLDKCHPMKTKGMTMALIYF